MPRGQGSFFAVVKRRHSGQSIPFIIYLYRRNIMHFKKLLCAFALVLFAAGSAHADLNNYLRSLNVSAEGNIGGFRTQVGVHYGASGPSLDLAFKAAATPAEAAVFLWLGQRTNTPVEKVVQVYESQKGQGWGAVAQSLGIKPGSEDFHALKAGNLGFQPEGAKGAGGKSDSGKGKGGK
jgi:hypothetical protein